MIALMHMDVLGRLDTVAEILPIAVADFDFHIAHHRARNPSHDTLEHVLIVELARRPPLAHGREVDDSQVLALTGELTCKHRGPRIGHCSFDETVWADG